MSFEVIFLPEEQAFIVVERICTVWNREQAERIAKELEAHRARITTDKD